MGNGWTAIVANRCDLMKPPAPFKAYKNNLWRVAEEDLAYGFVMGVPGRDLLGEGVDVAEAALEGAAGEDRVDAGGLVGPVGDRNSAGRGIGSTILGVTGVEARLGTASAAMLMPKSKRSLPVMKPSAIASHSDFPAVSLLRRLAGKCNSLLSTSGIFHKSLNKNDISTMKPMIFRLDFIFSLSFPVWQGMGRGAGLWETLKEHFRWVAEQHFSDGFVMGVPRLDLLREGGEVAEAAFEGAAGGDRVDAGGLVGPVGDRDGAGDRVGAGEARAGAVGDVNRG